MQLYRHGFHLEVFSRIDARQHPRSGMDQQNRTLEFRLYTIYVKRKNQPCRKCVSRLFLFIHSHRYDTVITTALKKKLRRDNKIARSHIVLLG